MNTWRRLALVGSGAVLAVGAFAPPSWSQAPPSPPPGTVVNSWALTPAGDDASGSSGRTNLSYDGPPGSEIHDKVTLFNFSSVQLNFRVYATDAFNNADGDFDLLAGDKRPTDVGTWVSLPQANVTLPARSQATMPVTIKVPANARPGDHAGAILASSQASGTGRNGKTVTLDRRTGARLYFRVAGPLAPELAVVNIHTKYRPALSPLGGSADVSYRVENRGNVRLGGTQQVSISGPLGIAKKTKAAVKLPELLPGQSVTLHATFDDVAASAVAVTKVHLEPKPVAKDVGIVPARTGRSLTFAVPFTPLALLLAVWLLARARRSYLRHRDEQLVVEARAR